MSEPSVEEIKKSSPFPLTDTDHYNLSLKDAEFRPHTWEELKTIIGVLESPVLIEAYLTGHAQNDLGALRRWPSDLKRYMKWSNETKANWGSVPIYIMSERLEWTPVKATPLDGQVFRCESAVPFKDERDYRIMPNDWPYGLEDGTTHIIVWLKTRLEAEATRGDLTDESRKLVEQFVQKTFVNPLRRLPGSASDRVMWFRNWTTLQSVPGLEHVHVLVRDVPQDVILTWTKGATMKQGW